MRALSSSLRHGGAVSSHACQCGTHRRWLAASAALLLMLAGAALPARAQSFNAVAPFPTHEHPNSIAWGDFNSDGVVDMAVPQYEVGLTLYVGDGTGRFVEAVTYTCGTPRASVARDFNGDGRLDVALTSEKGNAVLLFAGNGAGGFAPPVAFPVGIKPYFLSGADFNGDGNPDLAVANSSSATISVLLGDGAGHFAPQVQYAVGVTPRSVVPADFNGDGKIDLAVANFDSNTVSVLLGDGTGAFGNAFDVAAAAGPYLIAASDLNGDGVADLAVPNFNGGTLSILLNDGAVHFTQAASIPTATSPRHVAVADLNGDGRRDLVVSNRDASSISVLLGHASGGFDPPRTIGVGAGPFFTAVADVDADGHADLATVNRDAHTISVMLGDGTGTYAGPIPLKVGDGPRGIAAADFDSDGNLDLALPNYYSNSVSILRGTGDGRAVPAVSYAVSRSPWAATAADFNGDGHPDLAVTNASANNVSVLLNDGHGGFGAARNFAAGAGPVALVADDFNGDTILDLATANSGGGSVSVLLGNGFGGFGAAVPWAVGTAPSALAAGDLNQDGRRDLLVVNNGSGTITVLTGNGSGGFLAPATVAVGTSPSALALADLTGDGMLDLTVTASASGLVQLLAGNGAGSFTGVGSFKVGGTPLAVAAADFDGDGVLDLATSDAGANAVSVLRGLGAGAFAPATHVIAGLYPRALAIGDFTRDGRPDIGVANANSDDAWILVNSTGQADLAVSMDDGRTEVSAAETVTYTVVVTNRGPADAGSVLVSAQLPQGVTGAGWSCTPSPGSTCGVGAAGPLADTAFIRNGGELTYMVTGTLASNSAGTVTAIATVQNTAGVDGNPANNTASDVDVVSSNRAPTASDGQVTGFEDASAGLALAANDPENDPLTWWVVTAPSHGSLSETPPALTYTPDPNFNGTDAFAFQVNDGRASSNVATVTITVTPVNDAPVARAQSVPVAQETTVPIALTGTDTDGDTLVFTVVAPPAHGTLSGTAPSLSYTPESGYTGPDTIAFTVSDGQLTSAPATIAITVTPVNHPPTLVQPVPDVSVTDDSTEVLLELSGAFSDPDSNRGDQLTLSVSANSNPGLVSSSFSGSTLRLALAAGASGAATLRVRATDQQGVYVEDDFAISVARPPANISIADATVVEGNSGTRSLIFNLTLSTAASSPVTVPFSVSAVTAQPGADFTAIAGTVTFSPGITARTIAVPIVPDLLDEEDETVRAVLGTPTGAALSRGEALGTIVDDDTSALVISDVTVSEGNSGTAEAVFQVSLSRPNSRTVSVDYATGNSTAAAGLDYQATSGSLSFAPGVQTQTVTVAVLGDTLDEANEKFSVALGNASNAVISHAVGYGTIVDDDNPPVVSIADTVVTETNAGILASFTVSLSAPSELTTRVRFATSDGTALAGSDYRALTGTVTFAPGSTVAIVNVTVLGDRLAEPSETFFVTLDAPTLLTIGRAQALATIVDDDTPPGP